MKKHFIEQNIFQESSILSFLQENTGFVSNAQIAMNL